MVYILLSTLRRIRHLALLLLFGFLAAASVKAELPREEVGQVASLPHPFSAHWIWATDAVTERITLVDLETSRMLGVIDGGWGLTAALFSRDGRIFVPETHYSRGSRGVRTDVLTFYDAQSLAPTGEVILPPKRAMNPLPIGNAALSDDDRFVAIFNMTPATSISIVDVSSAKFTAEISTPGCSLVYAAGDRRFLMLCGNGELLLVELDEQGHEASKLRSDKFFDPIADPITEKAVRNGDVWLFVSFAGVIHSVDIAGDEPSFGKPWRLTDDPRELGDDAWRIGGRQFLAVHRASGRLYALMHRGGVDSHKQDGSEVWIYDLASQERIDRIELRSPGFTYLGVPLEFGQDWPWPFNNLYGWIVDLTSDAVGIGEIAVTQDDQPILVTAGAFSGSLAVYDALDGEFINRVNTGNMTTLILEAPPWPLKNQHAQDSGGTSNWAATGGAP
jgi:methylamine dehydrogenase heavy chain